jgi:hypothetical protein
LITQQTLVLNSKVDFLDPDLLSYPLVEQAHYTEMILAPGDLLYIPRWYWHLVVAVDHPCSLVQDMENSRHSIPLCEILAQKNCTTVTHSVSVNFWWGPRIEKEHSLE